ncbi:MFS transporter [Paractinoplanes ferrugineus]|uniref:MFS transporter n=1 Tax=Paractinoplanes ferrugineus TaxID=113564 RepID=UPI001EF2CA31|nr:MFS transporter [Actinoplanes ferrugineus]
MSEDPAARPDRADRPVTFRDVFAVREYRAIYTSLLVNWAGDYLSKAAVTVLVYEKTDSVLLSAAALGVSFIPWIIGGTLLSALAERYPYRRVLIVADLARMVPIGLLLVPHVPIWLMLVLVFLASLGMPPTQAARSALLPQLVGREKLATAIAVNQTTTQAAQLFGYLAGATIATVLSPRVALGVDVCTFALSALVIARGIQHRPPARTEAQRTHLLHESGEGIRLVFGRPVLRAIVLMVCLMSMFSVAPEGLAAAWAAEGTDNSTSRGLYQGLIMAAAPIGFVIGGLLLTRLAGADRRDRLVCPLAILSCLALAPAAFSPPLPIVVLLVILSGAAAGGLSPTLNGRFVLMLPHGYRARAFGVVQAGLQLAQFSGIIITGVLADRFRLPLVVGLWSVVGTFVMSYLAVGWPSRRTFARAMEAAAATVPPAPVPPATTPVVPAPAPAPEAAPVRTTSVTPKHP